MRLVAGIPLASGDSSSVISPRIMEHPRSTYRAGAPRRQKKVQRRETLGLLAAVEISERLCNGTPDAIIGIAFVDLVPISQKIGREDGVMQQ